MDVITLLQILIVLIVIIMALLVFFFIYISNSKSKKSQTNESITNSYEMQNTEGEKKKVNNFGRFQGELSQESIFNFMEFDEIVDNMIVRKNKTQYIMILQCNGINYDLMSEQEKLAVEEGFIQFLNTLRAPIQLYIQSRTLNLKDIIGEYKEKLKVVSNEIDKLKVKMMHAKKQGNQAEADKIELEKRRKENILSYGNELTDYVERLNANKNVLQQKIYLVVSFFVAELGENLENYSKEEIDNMCFSELYTRAQNLSSALASSQVTSRLLNSEELAELLYIAYNRDESEVYSLSKALEAQYDSLYSSGKDILQKKQEKLDKEINIEAIDLATDSILKADKQKQREDLEKEREKIAKVKAKANELLNMYEDKLDSRVFEIAKENIEKSTDKEKVPVKKVKKLKSGEEKKVAKKKSTET